MNALNRPKISKKTRISKVSKRFCPKNQRNQAANYRGDPGMSAEFR